MVLLPKTEQHYRAAKSGVFGKHARQERKVWEHG